MWKLREPGSRRVDSSHPGRARHGAGRSVVPVTRVGPRRIVAGAVALGSLLHALSVPAIEFGEGEVRGSLDTTISHGATWRVGARDEGRARSFLSANDNDGNLNYDRGIVSNTSKFTADLDLDYRNFGAFVRATGFFDFENEDGERDRTPLSSEARDLLGHEFDVLDAYLSGAFSAGDTAIDVRAGRHVLNWGESTFIQNGVNAFNRFDLTRLRLPGSELREALAPTSMASLSIAPTYALSVEGFYQFDWEETVLDPVGSYFSISDYIGAGAREAVLTDSAFEALLGPFGSDVDRGFSFGPLLPAINTDLQGYTVDHPQLGPVPAQLPPEPQLDVDFLTVTRGPDRKPGDSGQWGLALRYLAEDMNDTEFGLYFANYHSRLPLVGARSAPRESIEAGLAAAGAVSAATSHTVAALTQAVTAEVMRGVQAGVIDPADAEALIRRQVTEQASGIASALALDRYTETPDALGNRGHFFHEYPEDVQLLGMSFNTALGTSGWALQGDYTLHLDAPLQRAERTLLQEGLSPMVHGLTLASFAAGFAELAQQHAETNPVLAQQYAEQARQAQADLQRYLETYRIGDVRSHVRHEVSQVQVSATRVFGPMLGADALALVTEAALMHVHDMTDEPLEGPARASRLGGDVADGDADATSWGYRVAARLDYNNAIGAVNLFPYLQWRHDVNGNSPAPSGAFSQGATALTLGLRADYLSAWRADVGYTRYGGRRNTLRDRDFISASVNYSF